MKQNPKITVVGSNMVDLASYLDSFPALGETVFGRSFVQGFGGKGANQAVMAAHLGADVDIVTCVGDDLFNPGWFEHFRACGVGTRHISTISGIHSGVAAIWVEPAGDNRIVLGAGANQHLSVRHVDDAFAAIQATDLVLSQLEVPQAAVRQGFRHGRDRGATTILNPGPAAALDEGLLELTDWLLPNETELRILAARMFDMTDDDDVRLAARFAEASGVRVVVTLGGRGAAFADPGRRGSTPMLFEAPQVCVVDTTGAGDAFAGGFSFGIASGMTPEQSIRIAITVSADSVTKPGTAASYASGTVLQALLAKGDASPGL